MEIILFAAQIYAQGITYKVTSIGAKAFNNNKNLTKVTIGTNIEKSIEMHSLTVRI